MRFFLARFKVKVDGAEVGALRNGQERHFVVPAGQHEVRVTIDWQGSAPLKLEVPINGSVCLVCEPTRDPLAAAHAAQRDFEAIILRRE